MRDRLFEKCQTLPPNLQSGVDAHTSDVSAWPCQIRHDAAGHWITHGGDNGNRACCFLEPRDKPSRTGKDHVGLLGNGLMCDCCKSVFISSAVYLLTNKFCPSMYPKRRSSLKKGRTKGLLLDSVISPIGDDRPMNAMRYVLPACWPMANCIDQTSSRQVSKPRCIICGMNPIPLI